MKKNKKIVQNEQGFTLLEVLVSVVILAVGLLGIAALQLSAIEGNAYGMKLTEASERIEIRMEQLKALPHSTFMEELGKLPKDSAAASGGATVITEAQDADGFTRITRVEPDTPIPGAFSINVQIQWQGKIKNHQIAYQTIITG